MRKVISVLCLFTMLFFVLVNYSYADGPRDMSGLIADMSTANDMSEQGRIGKVINNVIGLLQMAGSGIALIVITILGIKYILASPSEKADVKKAIMPVIIGCILLFGAVNLVSAIFNFAAVVK
jgi:type IV secretory pathway VirB2 component (pilin)